MDAPTKRSKDNISQEKLLKLLQDAEKKAKEEKDARIAAEKKATDAEKKATDAEKKAKEEKDARIAAEKKAKEEKDARIAAEKQATDAEKQAKEEKDARIAAKEELEKVKKYSIVSHGLPSYRIVAPRSSHTSNREAASFVEDSSCKFPTIQRERKTKVSKLSDAFEKLQDVMSKVGLASVVKTVIHEILFELQSGMEQDNANYMVVREVTVSDTRPDLWVVYRYDTSGLVEAKGLLEVKLPGKGRDKMNNSKVAGQVFDYLKMLQSMGVEGGFLLLTTYEEWRLCWLPDDNTAVETKIRLTLDKSGAGADDDDDGDDDVAALTTTRASTSTAAASEQTEKDESAVEKGDYDGPTVATNAQSVASSTSNGRSSAYLLRNRDERAVSCSPVIRTSDGKDTVINFLFAAVEALTTSKWKGNGDKLFVKGMVYTLASRESYKWRPVQFEETREGKVNDIVKQPTQASVDDSPASIMESNSDDSDGKTKAADEEEDWSNVKDRVEKGIFLGRAFQKQAVHGVVCPAATEDGLLLAAKFSDDETALQQEANIWQEMYGETEVGGAWIVTLIHRQALLMPWVNPVSEEEKRDPATLCLVRQEMKRFIERGYWHDDLKWSNVGIVKRHGKERAAAAAGSVHARLVLFDFGRMIVRCPKYDTNSHHCDACVAWSQATSDENVNEVLKTFSCGDD